MDKTSSGQHIDDLSWLCNSVLRIIGIWNSTGSFRTRRQVSNSSVRRWSWSRGTCTSVLPRSEGLSFSKLARLCRLGDCIFAMPAKAKQACSISAAISEERGIRAIRKDTRSDQRCLIGAPLHRTTILNVRVADLSRPVPWGCDPAEHRKFLHSGRARA